MSTDCHSAVANSAVLQFRLMGGAIGLAIVTTVMNNYIKSHLANFLSSQQIDHLLKSTKSFTSLPPSLFGIVLTVLAKGFNLQMRVMTAFSAVQILVAFLLWRKRQITV
jgi:hypothetical protein